MMKCQESDAEVDDLINNQLFFKDNDMAILSILNVNVQKYYYIIYMNYF